MIDTDELINYASSFIGQKEKPHNMGFEDPDFDSKMRKMGFQNGFSWCSIFCKLVFDKFLDNSLSGLFSPSAIRTYYNFTSLRPKSKVDMPDKGYLAVWQRYKNGFPTWQGHIGIVSDMMDENRFKCIEGNSTVQGSREGDQVCLNTRNIDYTPKKNGLVLIGFVNIVS